MSRNHLIMAFTNGQILARQDEYKFSRGKIVRGSFYSYWLGDNKITEAQFEWIKDNFNYLVAPSSTLSRREYVVDHAKIT